MFARERAISTANTPCKPCAARSEGLEAHALQVERTPDVPGVGQHEAPRFMQLAKGRALCGCRVGRGHTRERARGGAPGATWTRVRKGALGRRAAIRRRRLRREATRHVTINPSPGAY